MADFAYGYITGWCRKGEQPHYGIILPAKSAAELVIENIRTSQRGEIFAWIVWLVEVEGVGVTMPVTLYKFRNGVETLHFDYDTWSDANPND